jgi:hypothetical protein
MPKVVDLDERRTELAEAAGRLIARSGLGAATMREVAAEAGWTTGALTHYELLLCTLQVSLARRRGTRPTTDGDPMARLAAALESALPVDDDRRRHWMVTIAFCAQSAGDSELADAQRDAYHGFRDRVAALVAEAGVARNAAALELAERLIAAADGIAIQALFDPQRWSAAHQLTTLHQLIGRLLESP